MILTSFYETIKFLLLGLIQGITEPLPVSSSAHVIVLSEVLSLNIPASFTLWVNIGSFIAILIFFRKFLWQIISGFFIYIFKKDDSRRRDFFYCLFIVVATIPAGIVGLIFKEQIDRLTSLLVIGICEVITGIILLLVSLIPKADPNKEVDFKTSLGMGFSQILALVPGISRSGITSSYALSQKVPLEKALRFSFMMYIPISIASTFLGIIEIDFKTIDILSYSLAFVASLGGTLVVITLFFNFIKKHNFKYFAYYCMLLGISILIYLGLKP